MHHPHSLSPRRLRATLAILVLLTVLPLLIYLTISNYKTYQDAQAQELVALTNLARGAAAENRQITEGARQLLITIASTPAISSGNPTLCKTFLSSLIEHYSRYSNLGVANQDGTVYCAADREQALLNPPTVSLITNTLASQLFTIGSYYATSQGDAVLNLGYPLNKQQVVYASLSLAWVGEFINTLSLPSDLVINVLDHRGTVLARVPSLPGAVGSTFAADPLVEQILTLGSGTTTRLGFDGVPRFYAFAPLDENKSLYFAAGLPQAKLFRDLRLNLLGSLATATVIVVLSLAVASYIGNRLIVEQLESLSRLNRLKDDFINLVSHQLRTPLTSIRWLTESLQDTIKTKSHLLQVASIHAASLRLISLTSTLLNISRLESGRLSPNLAPYYLKSLLEHAVKDLRATFPRAKVELVCKTNISLTTDKTLLGEILRILLNNAATYSPSHKTITLTAHANPSLVKISVRDTGIGIPSFAKQEIFSRFYRADNARAQAPGGTGLGLYLARLLAKTLGGELTFISRPQKSTTFTLTLPNKV